MSGRPVNVVVFVGRSTVPVSVSGNGDGNTSVNVSPANEPVRYACPVSGLGYSGEVAVAEPTGVQVPLARLGHRSFTAATFCVSTDTGSVSATDRLGASVAA